MFNTKEKLQDDIARKLLVIANEMRGTNKPRFNQGAELEISRISLELEEFGAWFGQNDWGYIRLRSSIDILNDKLEKRRSFIEIVNGSI